MAPAASHEGVSLPLRQPLANLYPMNRERHPGAFRANERISGFHYGMPSGLLEASGPEILAALKRYKGKKTER